MNDRRLIMPALGMLLVLLIPMFALLAWTKVPGPDINRWGAAFLIHLMALIFFAALANSVGQWDDSATTLSVLAFVPPVPVYIIVLLVPWGSAMMRAWLFAELGLFLYGMMMSIVAILQGEPGDQSEHNQPAKKKRSRNKEAERERDERLAELKAAEGLDDLTIEAQRQEIEETYQHKVAQRSNA